MRDMVEMAKTGEKLTESINHWAQTILPAIRYLVMARITVKRVPVNQA
jgi:hypothetical protein